MYYSRIKRRHHNKQEKLKTVLGLAVAGLTFTTSVQAVNTDSYVTDSKTANEKLEQPVNLKAPTQLTADTASIVTGEIASLTTPQIDEIVYEKPLSETAVADYEATVAPVYETTYYQAPATSYSQGTLANGNTAGAIGSEAAAQMAAATGVPQETWEYIIARESNGNPNVANASGASGLFQTMPGWGSTATVQDQINSALNAYHSQGLAAWGMQ